MMKKILLLSISLTSLLNYAQKLKSENLEFKKKNIPTLVANEIPVDLVLIRTTSSDFLNQNDITNTYVHTPDFLSNNTSNPKYIAIVDYLYTTPISRNEKMGSALTHLAIESKTKAILYIIERGKGVFSSQSVELLNSNGDNLKSVNLVNTIFEIKSANAEAVKFLDGNSIKKSLYVDVEKKQIERLTQKAYDMLKTGMTSFEYNNRFEFNYLKSDDSFDFSNFDKAYQSLKLAISPINSEQILNSIAEWRTEEEKYASNTDKNIKKYRIGILENILSSYVIINNFDKGDDIVSKLEQLDPKNRTASWYIKQKNQNASSDFSSSKSLVYTELPQSVIIPQNSQALFSSNGVSSVPELKINKVRTVDSYNYHSILNLSTIQYALNAFKSENLLLKYQNDLMNEIVFFILDFDHNIKGLNGASKKEIPSLTAFAKKINKEFIDNKVFKFNDSKSVKLANAREYISKNYKLEDFYPFIPEIDRAKQALLQSKKEGRTDALIACTDLNSILKMRNLIANDNWMEEKRKEKESIVNKYLEDTSKLSINKEEVYHEFKNTINVLENIKNKRRLSDEEIDNYHHLMNRMMNKLNQQ